MARPERANADYFPFYAKDGRTLFLLESKYQCKGTGFFTNVMRFLTLETHHHVKIQEETDRLYFFSKCHCDEESALDMLNIMSKTGKINNELWQVRVIASQDLLDSLTEAYKNRKNKIISMAELIKKYISYPENPITSPENPVTSSNNTQRKGKEIKGKERKGNIYLSDSEEYRLSEFLFEKIKNNNPQFKEPNLQIWANHIDLMIRKDNRSPENIRLVIEFCQDDNFWKMNILSTQKLREKFDQLYMKMNNGGNNGKSKGQPERFDEKQYIGTDPDQISWGK